MSPSMTTPPKLELPYEAFELSCGARLFVSPRPGAPVTAVRVHLRGGAASDEAGKEGRAYLTGALADQGTTRSSADELAARLEPAGGELSGDASGLSGQIAGGRWKLLVDVLAELLLEASYPKDRFDRHKQRLLTRLGVERNDPRAQGGKRFRKLVYGKHWLGRTAWGTLESIESLRASDLRSHRKRSWVGRRATIAVCGDLNPAAVARHFERALAGWTPGKPFSLEPPKLPSMGVRVDAFRRSREQVHVYLGHLGIRRKDPDFPALTVMDHVLGTGPGFANRITRRLRDELGLAYTVHADIHSSAGIHPGMFTAYIGTSPEHLATAIEGFLVEMRRIQDEPVSQAELETAKRYLVGSFTLGFERASRRANYLIASHLYGLPEDNLQRLPREFSKVTVEDVQRVAARHLHPDACCLAAAGPVNKAELRALLDR